MTYFLTGAAGFVGGRLAQMLRERGRTLPEMYSSEAMRVQAGITYLGNNAKARLELGYNPKPLEEGLRETLAYELKNLTHQA
jgi:nucleoside-diphosphate-sugar epimerase